MWKRLITTTLAGSLALTSLSVTPAQAGSDSDKVLRFLAGVATVAIIAKAIDDDKKRDRKRATNKAPVAKEYDRVIRPYDKRGTITPYYGPRGIDNRHTRRWIPGHCERVIATERGHRSVVAAPCLKRAGYRSVHLPDHCKVKVELKHRTIAAWRKRCLTKNGYHFQ